MSANNLIVTDIKGNAKIKVHNRSTNTRSEQVSGLVDSVMLYQTNLYMLKIQDKSLNTVDFSKTMINPEFAPYFQILNVCDGIVTILPLVDNFILPDGSVIGAMS